MLAKSPGFTRLSERTRLARFVWARLRQELRALDEERRLQERFPRAEIGERVRVVSPHLLQLGDRAMIQRDSFLHCGGLEWSFGRGGITIADDVTISDHCILWGAGTIAFERAVGMGPGCMVLSSADRYESDPEDIEVAHDFAPVRLVEYSHVYSGTIIAPGVTIGRGAVVGSQSLVLRDVPPMELWAGVPARKVRDIDPDRWRPPTRSGKPPPKA